MVVNNEYKEQLSKCFSKSQRVYEHLILAGKSEEANSIREKCLNYSSNCLTKTDINQFDMAELNSIWKYLNDTFPNI